MGSYTLSQRADEDILQIARSSAQHWGALRTERYILGLHAACERLAEYPDIGRKIDNIRPGYLQMESASHAIFYRKTGTGILIVRVLHERMDVKRHL
jgi:toxin ParE1/3/4